MITDNLVLALSAAALVAFGFLRASHRHAFTQALRQREAELFSRRLRGSHRTRR